MTELHYCPICSKQLEQEHKIKYIDYHCMNDDHYFGKRLIGVELTKVKVRFREVSGEKLYIKFNYDMDFTEVWAIKPSNEVEHIKAKRIPIAGTSFPDYTDIDKLKQKIKTYLIFS